MFDKGPTQLDRLLSLERAARNLEGQQGTNAAGIARARGRIEELELQILQIDTLRIEKAEEQARDAAARENQVRERLASVRERVGRMEVRAPVAGVGFGMTVSTAREVVHPGEDQGLAKKGGDRAAKRGRRQIAAEVVAPDSPLQGHG